jgi:hypothetical protein
MLLCGAQLEVRAGDQAAAVELLARAVETAPAELSLPDGRRLRPPDSPGSAPPPQNCHTG